MQNLYIRIRNYLKLPQRSEINSAFSSFSKREWHVFTGLVVVLLLTTILILGSINTYLSVEVPLQGGHLSEGIVGTPRFINPVMATSLVDQDLVSLIYSGLVRKSSDGALVPDLAEKYETSENGLVYTFTLKDKIYFHDGKPVTVGDVLFTIGKAKDSIIKSPQKINWDGVSAEKVDEKTIRFTLRQPRASFLEATTLGIMPSHVWNNSPIELNEANTNPVGSGPYQITKVNKQASGIIDYYELTSFKKFVLHRPYIKNIDLYFYPNEEDAVSALMNDTVDQTSSITPLDAKALSDKDYYIESSTLPRVFGLFFNPNVNQLFIDKAVVTAIDQAIDKEKIVRDVLLGYGVVIDSPIPPTMNVGEAPTENTASREEIVKKVQADLEKAGWKVGTSGFLEKTTTENKKKITKILEFSISTSSAPELARAALLIQEDLAVVGMKVDIKTFEIGNLNQGVIRPRAYDALLFGQIINHESDLFAFWHSSQRKDPGLNVSMYANVKVDKILEDAFVTIDAGERMKKYAQFSQEIQKDMPAVFLYSPNFIYVVSKNLNGLTMDSIISPADRFSNVYSWYTQTEKVWKIFAR